MSERKYSLFIRRAIFALLVFAPFHAAAQDKVDTDLKLTLPGISGYAPATGDRGDRPLALGNLKQVTLSAQLTAESPELTQGVIWRVFRPEPGDDGKLPLVADEQGGTRVIALEPGSYLVHAAFGRAGATKRITVGNDEQRENFILEAGGLKLDAVLANGMPIPPSKLKFSISEAAEGSDGDRALIVPNVSPNSIVRLNAGVYHVVSTYGVVNAVIRSDIRVEAGKLTEATVEHKAAQLTLKLVRASGGEAIADTSWSVLTESGDVVRESVGPFASMVLAEGNYAVVAKNRDRIYQKDFEVKAGQNRDVEVITSEDAADIRSDGSERAAVE